MKGGAEAEGAFFFKHLQEVMTVRVQDPRVQNEGSWNSYVDYKIFLHVSRASGMGSCRAVGCAEVEMICGCPQQSETGDLEETECGEERAPDVIGNCFQAV